MCGCRRGWLASPTQAAKIARRLLTSRPSVPIPPRTTKIPFKWRSIAPNRRCEPTSPSESYYLSSLAFVTFAALIVALSVSITIKDAERLDGKTVVTTFTVGAAPFTWGEGKNLHTVTAPKSNGAVDRTVILQGNRLHDSDLGAKLTVVGTLRVIKHPAGMVGAMAQGPWTELRIEEE
jgi:hypothetical protein